MADGVDHAAQLRGVLALHGLADPAQAERAQGVALAAVGAVGRLDLLDDQGHASTVSSASAGASASPAASGAGTPLPPSPSTRSTERPRRAATSSGRRRPCRPAIVALTRLIGFCVPSDLERMSWIPASSSNARTPTPASNTGPGRA